MVQPLMSCLPCQLSCRPYCSAEWDEKHIFPIDTLKKAAELGACVLLVSLELARCVPGWWAADFLQSLHNLTHRGAPPPCTGFAGLYVSEDVGGAGLSRLDAAIIFEALSWG